MTWDGDEYQARFDALAAQGRSMHGEADLVMTYDPASVLDAGCGTGRVAIELAARGVDVVGTDIDTSMLATAQRQAPHLSWVASDLADLDLGREFDVVVMAGNVVLFTSAGAQAAVVAGAARHVAAGGVLLTGFGLGRGVDLDEHDGWCQAADLTPEDRWAAWDKAAWPGDGSYVVATYRKCSRG